MTRTTGYYTYEVYDTTITYSFANGGEWRVDGSDRVFTSQRAVYLFLED